LVESGDGEHATDARDEVIHNPAGEKLRDALREQGMSTEEMAWVLGFTREAVGLIQAATVIPTTALRLEAALDIPANEWLPAAAPEDLWLLSERMAAELAMTRHRRQLLSDRRGSDGDWAPCNQT
jgi:plasmid maintenance system antidote protein VapI